MTSEATDTRAATTGASVVLLTLCAGQFLMALDSSVMNVSIATVAKDLNTTITGIQSAIVLYTLVMAMPWSPAGRSARLSVASGHSSIGLIIYCSGSLTTALAPNLPVLLFGWSLLEGIGAALIMPAIVALVAELPTQRPTPRLWPGRCGRRDAVAVGPLIGGLATTYASWRWVFAGEVLVGPGIFLFGRRIADAPVTVRSHLDLLGSLLWALGDGSRHLRGAALSDWDGSCRPRARHHGLRSVADLLAHPRGAHMQRPAHDAHPAIRHCGKEAARRARHSSRTAR